jgi:hypothetical protein
MSAYTPKLGGDKGDVKVAIDYAPKNDNMEIPAILRLKPAEPQARDGAMRIKLQSAPRETPVAVSVTEAECRAFQKMMGSVASADTLTRTDSELLAQIPRLKETLRALDSEMNANATSDLEKRLAVHARILELQGAELKEVRKAVDKTVHSMGQILQQQKVHAQLHEETGRLALKTKDTTEGLHTKMKSFMETERLHKALHNETAKGVLELRSEMHDMQKNEALRDDVHLEMGAHVLEMQKERNIVKELHKETISQLKGVDKKVSGVQRDVVALQTGAKDVRKDTELHARIHLQVGEDMKKLETRLNDRDMNSDRATKRSVSKHKIEKQETAALSTKSFASAGDVDVRKLRSDLDAALAKLKVQENMCMSTSNIVKGLGEQMLGRKAADAAANPSVDKEKRMLALLQSDLASSNARGQNRRK